ncbi:tRNA(Ile)(2)-agmatinylcytidine synthase [Candidatus Bathyarchaeota archaeon]|nr:tRNA(Ile)(2)-agmatinylcytidine synthase [Candidatus Bathyarchaeota archaeon]
MVKLHIGFDDTDSPNEGCTTYIAAILVEKLSSMGVSFTDYPSLVRLNPNVPWKTRGNGALCLQLICPENSVETIKETVIDTVEANSELGYGGTDPGIVFISEEVPQEIRDFAKKAEQSILTIEAAVKLAKRVNAEALGFKKGRGIIGGLAAIGEDLNGDHTFEIISYRTPENRDKPRRVHASSVKTMDKNSSLTFNNVDPETGRVLITPRGPDPILCGIRGETPEAVKQAYEMVTIDDPVERWMIFRTNQGTDAHLRRVSAVADIQPYNPVVAQGVVSNKPKVIQGGHVIFSIKDETGEVNCAAYEPTVSLCKTARKLMVGDIVKVYGGVRPSSSEHQLTINLEKMRILELAPRVSFVNPSCPECTKRMKSMGKNQGFRCDKCGFRSSQLKKLAVNEERGLERGLYITSQRSQRHLTKPYCRYGKEKTGASKEMIENWHYP